MCEDRAVFDKNTALFLVIEIFCVGTALAAIPGQWQLQSRLKPLLQNTVTCPEQAKQNSVNRYDD
jgi:hypothetical protein